MRPADTVYTTCLMSCCCFLPPVDAVMGILKHNFRLLTANMMIYFKQNIIDIYGYFLISYYIPSIYREIPLLSPFTCNCMLSVCY